MGFLNRLFGRREPGWMPGRPTMDMGDMVRTLASLPEDQRQAMIRTRLQRFADQGEGERKLGMRAMLTAALELPGSDYRRLAGSRMTVLMGLPQDQQMRLMKTHVSVLMELPPDKQNKEMQVMKELLMDLPEGERSRMVGMMEQLGMKM